MRIKIFKLNSFIRASQALLIGALLLSAPQAFAQTPPNVPVSSSVSENWSGYVATGSTYHGVSGTWTIPTPGVEAQEPIAADATWVGIGGVSSQDLIQAGTEAIQQNGQMVYQAWYELIPETQQQIPLTVRGGDSVSVSINETSSGVWQLSFTDNTTGQNYQTSVSYSSSGSSAEWIEEMPVGESSNASLGFVPLDYFGTVSFSGAAAMVTGVSQSLAALGAQPLTMAIGTTAVATPSSIGTDGASFSITRTSAAIAASPQGPGRGWHRNGVGVQRFIYRPMPQSQQVPSGQTTSYSEVFYFRVGGGGVRGWFLRR